MFVEFAHYKEMDELGHVQVDGKLARLIAVGWPGSGCDLNLGSVPDGFVNKLTDLISRSNYRTTVIRGYQPCPFCDYHGMICDSEPRMGGGILLIPWDGDFFLGPDLILHYVVEHQYAPPQFFIDAVMSVSSTADFDAAGLLDRAVETDAQAKGEDE